MSDQKIYVVIGESRGLISRTKYLLGVYNKLFLARNRQLEQCSGRGVNNVVLKMPQAGVSTMSGYNESGVYWTTYVVEYKHNTIRKID